VLNVSGIEHVDKRKVEAKAVVDKYGHAIKEAITIKGQKTLLNAINLTLAIVDCRNTHWVREFLFTVVRKLVRE
jgi:hypothetical protein